MCPVLTQRGICDVFNENQLATLLSLLLSSEQLLHERCLPVFDSAIIAMPQAMQSCTKLLLWALCTNYIIAYSTCMGCCIAPLNA